MAVSNSAGISTGASLKAAGLPGWGSRKAITSTNSLCKIHGEGVKDRNPIGSEAFPFSDLVLEVAGRLIVDGGWLMVDGPKRRGLETGDLKPETSSVETRGPDAKGGW